MKTPNTLRHALLLFAVAGSAAGQSIGFYSDLQYNSGSGSASTFAQTWSDYSTQYYYDISVYSQLNVSQNGGPFRSHVKFMVTDTIRTPRLHAIRT